MKKIINPTGHCDEGSGIEKLAHYIERNPIYIKYAAGIVPFRFTEVLYSFTDLMFLADGETKLYLEDYGIKWAKTREELISA